MKKILMVVSYAALAAVVIVPCLFWMGRLSLHGNIVGLNIATVAWFVTAPIWMEHKAD